MKKSYLFFCIFIIVVSSCTISKQQKAKHLSEILVLLRESTPNSEIKMLDGKVCLTLIDEASFKHNTLELTPTATSTLKTTAQILNKYSQTLVYLNGYVNNRGYRQANEKISFDKAVAIKKYLQLNNVKSSRISTFGYEESFNGVPNRIEMLIYYK